MCRGHVVDQVGHFIESRCSREHVVPLRVLIGIRFSCQGRPLPTWKDGVDADVGVPEFPCRGLDLSEDSGFASGIGRLPRTHDAAQ